MGVMKRSLLIVLALFMAFAPKANASVTVEQTTDPEYVVNSGYSELTAEEVYLAKKRLNGEPAEPLYTKSRNKFVRFCKNVYAYIDPAADSDERIHHDIKAGPSWRDL